MKKEQFELLEKVARKYYDGHLTIMRFTTNWRISFSTPDDREDIGDMIEGKTFDEAYMKMMVVLVAKHLM